MVFNPRRGRAALRRGRVSQPHAEYFLTVCTDQKRIGLAEPAAGFAVLDECHAMTADGTWTLRCMVVMPDHIHLIMTLGERLPLGKTMQRLKARTSSQLGAFGLDWERDFFDRRLRPDDDRLALFLYLYLNPYRAGLVIPAEKWPYYFCRQEDWLWFADLLNEERPLPEWLV